VDQIYLQKNVLPPNDENGKKDLRGNAIRKNGNK
jgi:hypothetical protein